MLVGVRPFEQDAVRDSYGVELTTAGADKGEQLDGLRPDQDARFFRRPFGTPQALLRYMHRFLPRMRSDRRSEQRVVVEADQAVIRAEYRAELGLKSRTRTPTIAELIKWLEH